MNPTNKILIKLSQRTQATVRMFCFPHAGGAASYFNHWAKKFSPWVDLFSIQYPGRETRWTEKSANNLIELSKEIADTIAATKPNLPYAFFGHSLGALICYETTRQLRDHHPNYPAPKRLFFSGRRAPTITHSGAKFSALPDQELIEKLSQMNGTPRQVLENQELMELMLPIIKADFRLEESYNHKTSIPLDQDFVILAGDSDPHVELKKMNTWGELTTGQSTIHVLPGGHFYLKSAEPQFLELLEFELKQL